MELKINLNNNSYSIFIEKGILNNAVDYINKVYKNKKIYIITDDNVSKLYLSSLINNLKANYDVDYVVVHHDGHIERCRGEPFNSLYRHPQDKIVSDFIELPCGKCIDCRIKYSKAWADRCMLEASYYDSNYFITLTYDDAHLPFSSYDDNGVIKQAPTLALRDFQLFLKRLRKQGYKFRYFMCG